MTTHKKAKAVELKNISDQIKGPLVFQRVGQGMATFKAVSAGVLSNPLVQLPAAVLPEDYSPEKYDVTGSFIYIVTVKEK